jgi:hypothetical protein
VGKSQELLLARGKLSNLSREGFAFRIVGGGDEHGIVAATVPRMRGLSHPSRKPATPLARPARVPRTTSEPFWLTLVISIPTT